MKKLKNYLASLLASTFRKGNDFQPHRAAKSVVVFRNPRAQADSSGSSGRNPKRASTVKFTTNGYNEIIEP
jgi:hypothetical protein